MRFFQLFTRHADGDEPLRKDSGADALRCTVIIFNRLKSLLRTSNHTTTGSRASLRLSALVSSWKSLQASRQTSHSYPMGTSVQDAPSIGVPQSIHIPIFEATTDFDGAWQAFLADFSMPPLPDPSELCSDGQQVDASNFNTTTHPSKSFDAFDSLPDPFSQFVNEQALPLFSAGLT